jgi:hypothetical protein
VSLPQSPKGDSPLVRGGQIERLTERELLDRIECWGFRTRGKAEAGSGSGWKAAPERVKGP